MVNLRIPGPIPVPDDILDKMSTQMMNHRGPKFKEMLFRITDGLKQVFQTENDIFVLTSSGTGAMEAAVANTLSPGEKVLCASIGSFGDRFGKIASTFGADVTMLNFPQGTAVVVDELRRALDANPEITSVLVTHNETNTGVTNDLERITKVVKGEFDKLLLVDGISSVCSLPLKTDEWDLDVVATASQKGWMLPPGLAFISMSERAWAAHEKSTMPRFYFNLSEYKRYYDMGQPPWTPNLSAMYALDYALKKIIAEGVESVWKRHANIAQMTRDGIRALGLEVFPDDSVASNTVTSVKMPEGVDADELRKYVLQDHNVVLAGAYGELTGKMFRIGHLGYVSTEEIEQMLDAIKASLPKVGIEG
jgi:aspartate aminotransferase-like enzyme